MYTDYLLWVKQGLAAKEGIDFNAAIINLSFILYKDYQSGRIAKTE